MINNLRELNDKVNAFANYVVKTACERTMSGQYYISIDDACGAVGMSHEDFLQYKDFIFEELYSREELLEFDFDDRGEEIDVNCALNYCPHYEWCNGDEDIFECTYEEWLERPTLPVSQPLSVAQMAEIGAGAISFLAYKEEKNLDDVVKNVLCFEGDMAQAVIDTVEAREREVVAKLDATILENDAKLKQNAKVLDDLVVQFAKLWGMKTADLRNDEYSYLELEAFDSEELYNLLSEWAKEYCTLNCDDTVEFFETKLSQLTSSKPALDDVISSCENMSKKTEVADVRQHRNDKDER